MQNVVPNKGLNLFQKCGDVFSRHRFLFILVLVNFVTNYLFIIQYKFYSDDWSLIVNSYQTAYSYPYLLLDSQRPIYEVIFKFQVQIFQDYAPIYHFTGFITTTIILILIYKIAQKFFSDFGFPDDCYSFLTALTYCVLFNKDEFYPWALFCFGFPYIIYLISFYSYINKERKGYFAISLTTYTIGLFTYEIGVALPVIFFFYDFLLKKDFKKSFLYAIPLAFCLIVRKTQWFGYGHVFGDHGFGDWGITSLITHSVEFLGVSGFMIFRQILYAIKGWATIGVMLTVIIIVIVMVLYLIYRNMELPNTPQTYNYRFGLFILIVIAAFVFPYILQGGVLSGGVATRSFIFIDIGIALFLTSLVIFLSRFSHIKIILLVLIGLSMLLCQGLYMNWVVSGTIQEDVYTYIGNHADQISEYDLIYFNTTSFVRNKPNAIDETVLYPIAEFFFKVTGRDSAALEQRRAAQQGKLDGSVFIQEYDRYYNAKCLDEYALADMLYKKVDNFNRTKLVYGKMSVNIPLEVTSGHLVYQTSYPEVKIKTVNMSQVLDINYDTIYIK